MKLRATYVMKNANPFIPSFSKFLSQFKYAEATVPDNSDMVELENFAKQKTPEGYYFVKMEVIEKGGEG